MHRIKIPSILGTMLLLVGVFNGVILIQNRQLLKTEAINNSLPKNVRITNINANSFSVSWTTDSESQGFVLWGSDPDKINNVSLEETSNPSKIHLVSINNLRPLQNYSFIINSGGGKFDNSGIPWNVTTGPDLIEINNQIHISGSVITSLGGSVSNALVFATPTGGSTVSTKTTQNGQFVISLANARKKDLSGYISLEPKTAIEIMVLPSNLEIASAIATLESSNSLPPIKLGQTHDFTTLSPAPQTQVPDAEIIIPDNL